MLDSYKNATGGRSISRADALLLLWKYLPAIVGLSSIVLMEPIKSIIGNYIIPDLDWLNKIAGTNSDIHKIVNSTKSAFSTTIIAFFALMMGIAQLLVINRDSIIADLRKEADVREGSLNEKVNALSDNFREVRDRFDRPGKLQKVRIALFDRLLIYSPLFVAKEMDYFKEEGLDIEFVSIGSDRVITDKVSKNEFQFGACDPFFCIANANSAGIPSTQILIPLAKRLGLYILANSKSEATVQQGGEIVIGSYAEGSTTYLAAFAFKSWLESALTSINVSAKVVIDPRGPEDDCFSSPSKLKSKMKAWTFAALWEPNVSWLLDGAGSEFGVVAIAAGLEQDEAPLFKIFCGRRPVGATGYLDEGKTWRAWTPGGSDGSAAHKCLVSALITNRAVIEREPELARRIFRAVSRANIHLHALDEVEDSASSNSLWKKIRSALKHGSTVDESVLKTLVGETPQGMSADERGGVIPFVPGISHYQQGHYLNHLQACHKLWNENSMVPTVGVFGAANDYGVYFVKTDDFALKAH